MDLKPCPMCNGTADILTNGDISYVFCVDCGCRTAFVQHESESIAVDRMKRRIRDASFAGKNTNESMNILTVMRKDIAASMR